MSHVQERTALADIIRNRRAVKKKYNDVPVKEETVLELLEQAKYAPSHGMRQPWRFVFVGGDQTKDFAKKVAATYPEERRENREAYLNRSEEHTSELQSRFDLVCRLLLEKKKT